MPGGLSRWRAAAAASSRFPALLVLAVAVSAAAYAPITRNYFYADDFLNLFAIANTDPLTYLLWPHGGHLLVTRNALFYVSDLLFGANAEPYFWVVLCTHLLNVVLLFYVVSVFTGSQRLACFGAVLWGSAPVHADTLGWYSVYGQVVAGTAVLGILAIAASASARRQPLTRSRWVLCYALALIACSSFGVGIGVALVLPVVVALLFPGWRQWARCLPGWSLVIVVPAFYFSAQWLYAVRSGTALPAAEMLTIMQLFDPTVGSPGASPPLVEMMRAYFMHWYVIPYLLLQLVLAGISHLALAPLRLADAAGAVRYGVAGVFLGACVVGVTRSPGETRRQIAACAVLALGCYGMIALGRASFYHTLGADPKRTVVTIEASSAAPRYHYAALLPLTVLACVVLGTLDRWIPGGMALRNTLLIGWLAVTGARLIYADSSIDHHDRSRRETQQTLAAIQSKIDATPAGEDVYIANRFFGPIVIPFPTRFPGWAGAFVIFHPDNTVDGRRVYFVDTRAELIAALQNGRRTRGLFVSPEQAQSTSGAHGPTQP